MGNRFYALILSLAFFQTFAPLRAQEVQEEVWDLSKGPNKAFELGLYTIPKQFLQHIKDLASIEVLGLRNEEVFLSSPYLEDEDFVPNFLHAMKNVRPRIRVQSDFPKEWKLFTNKDLLTREEYNVVMHGNPIQDTEESKEEKEETKNLKNEEKGFDPADSLTYAEPSSLKTSPYYEGNYLDILREVKGDTPQERLQNLSKYNEFRTWEKDALQKDFEIQKRFDEIATQTTFSRKLFEISIPEVPVEYQPGLVDLLQLTLTPQHPFHLKSLPEKNIVEVYEVNPLAYIESEISERPNDILDFENNADLDFNPLKKVIISKAANELIQFLVKKIQTRQLNNLKQNPKLRKIIQEFKTTTNSASKDFYKAHEAKKNIPFLTRLFALGSEDARFANTRKILRLLRGGKVESRLVRASSKILGGLAIFFVGQKVWEDLKIAMDSMDGISHQRCAFNYIKVGTDLTLYGGTSLGIWVARFSKGATTVTSRAGLVTTVAALGLEVSHSFIPNVPTIEDFSRLSARNWMAEYQAARNYIERVCNVFGDVNFSMNEWHQLRKNQTPSLVHKDQVRYEYEGNLEKTYQEIEDLVSPIRNQDQVMDFMAQNVLIVNTMFRNLASRWNLFILFTLQYLGSSAVDTDVEGYIDYLPFGAKKFLGLEFTPLSGDIFSAVDGLPTSEDRYRGGKRQEILHQLHEEVSYFLAFFKKVKRDLDKALVRFRPRPSDLFKERSEKRLERLEPYADDELKSELEYLSTFLGGLLESIQKSSLNFTP